MRKSTTKTRKVDEKEEESKFGYILKQSLSEAQPLTKNLSFTQLFVFSSEQLKQTAMQANKKLFDSSSKDSLIPFRDLVEQRFSSEQLSSAFSETISKLKTETEEKSRTVESGEFKESLREALRVWTEAESSSQQQVTDLAMVLEETLFPYNKFSRKKASVKGSSLYLPGLIKAISTRWQYKKIMCVKNAGGKRSYNVCIALDVSLSMSGHLEVTSREALLYLIAALKNLGVENFSLLVFGEKVHIVKFPTAEWNAETILRFFSQLPSISSTEHYASNDAAAIHCGLDLFAQASVRGPKTMFVITDGYSTCGLRLSEALVRAQNETVDVIGVGVGLDSFNLKSFYGKWVSAAFPSLLPDAFRQLCSDGDQQQVNVDPDWNSFLPTVAGAEDTQDIWKTKVEIFDNIKEKLRGEREATLTQGNSPGLFLVNVCFVIDCTGSMSPWMKVVKVQISQIVSGIGALVNKQYPTLDLENKG
eukprot:TRINITY_DN7141_c0_g1_i1.p1 TRINITY_DN7141_c0_g1~~TRINITY_DN7141_c0_g1_i1.p1  ORF type:complete len:476 (-),score=133.21 TRINITY_DN7141_c0_g1_i1:2214-3641(-)